MMATRSEIDIASSWSWVTKTEVTRSRWWSSLISDPHAHAERRIEVAEGLVEQEHGGLPDERPAEGHTLLLAARQLARQPLQQVLQLQRGGDLPDAGRGSPPCGRLRRRSVKPMFSATVMCGYSA